jgi:hypothetical protein
MAVTVTVISFEAAFCGGRGVWAKTVADKSRRIGAEIRSCVSRRIWPPHDWMRRSGDGTDVCWNENNKASRAREWSRVRARLVATETLGESWATVLLANGLGYRRTGLTFD